jgi:hypothetical protein
MECQVKNRKAEHSDSETAPEMFTVYGLRKPEIKLTACLAHAVIAEARGHRVEIILT